MITKYDKSSDPSCGDINGWIAKIKWQWNQENTGDPIADPNCDNSNQPRPDNITLPPLQIGCYYAASYIGAVITLYEETPTTLNRTGQWDNSYKCNNYIPIFNQRRNYWEMQPAGNPCVLIDWESGEGSRPFDFQLDGETQFQRTPAYSTFKRSGTVETGKFTRIGLSPVNAVRYFDTNSIQPGRSSRQYEECNVQGTRPNRNVNFTITGGCIQKPIFWIPVYEVYLFCPGKVPELAYKNPDPCFNKEPESGSDRGEQNSVLPLGDKNRSSLWRVNGNTLSNGINNQTLTPPRPNASLSVQFVFCGCGSCEQSCGNCCVDCLSIALDIKDKLGLNNNNDPGSGG